MTVRAATPGDAAAIAALIDAQNEREGTLDSSSPPDDAVVHVAVDGTIDAAGWLDATSSGRTVVHAPTPSSERVEDLLRSLVARAPHDRSLRIERVLRTETPSLPAGTVTTYERFGFEFFYIELGMVRALASLPDAQVTGSARIERWTPAHDLPLRDAYNDAFSTRGLPGYSEHDWHDERFSAQDDFLSAASFVAIADETIAGFVMCVADAHEGWIDSVGVRSAWRGRGIIDALLLRSMQAMREAGMDRAVLRVNEDNARAIAVYRRLGFEVRCKHAVWTKPAYG